MLRRNLVAAVLRQGPSIQRLGRAVASTHSVYVWGTGPPSTPVGPLETVNPFWSTNIQQAAKGEGHVRLAAQSSGHPQQSLGVGGVERLRERILRDAEEQFARELKKMPDGDSTSFTSVRSAGGEHQRDHQGGDQSKAGGGPPETPPGTTAGPWTCSPTYFDEDS